MWKKFSIKIQLIIFMSLVVTVIELSTLFFVFDLQTKENIESAKSETEAITKSLNNDLLKVMLNPNADKLSDITYRLSAFEKINGLILYDVTKNGIYKYKNDKKLKGLKETLFVDEFILKDKHVFIKKDIIAEGYTFGYALLDIDITKYIEKQLNTTYTILAIFPFALIFGLFISTILSRSFTKPFFDLLSAMKQSDPTNDMIVKVKTDSNNEIKDLFDGFNKQMEQISLATKELHFQATHDQLTGIYNRFFMDEAILKALKDDTIEKGNNLLFIDLDQFKIVNDSAGTEAGDKLLKMIVTHYKAILPEDAIFARIDGDGFGLLLKNYTFEYAKELLEKSLDRLHDFRFTHNNDTYSVSATISMVHFKPNQFTLKELFKASTTALYTAKQKGRNKSHIYDPNDEKMNRVSIELDTAKLIKEALGDGPARFELFAQDIVPLQYETDKIGYEILIRMWDKDNNFISPDNFLPAAERYQLMSEIDVWVLWTYLETVTKDKKHIDKLHSAHINLAGSSLNNPDFQAKVKEAVEHFDFPWEKLELEVTESSAIGSFNMANEFISWVKDKKIGLALDDFGTGMASFEYLKSMPFDVVKVDGSFVKDMHKDPTDKAVIKYIQEIASLKGQETVAEYVETIEDVNELRDIGITYGQGYYLGKPRSLSSWLEN